MNASIGVGQFNKLKNEFKIYLRESNPNWSESFVSTICSDAFFALNNNVGVDFWASLVSEETLLLARDKIRDFLSSAKDADNLSEQADHYLASLRQLQIFLSKNHPSLPSEWSGKSVNDVNLRSDFQVWMKKQKKPNGEKYSPNTVNAYTTALKNATGKLNLSGPVNSDLFSYSSIDDFENAQKIILAAPNFNDVDISAGNKAYSNGMTMS